MEIRHREIRRSHSWQRLQFMTSPYKINKLERNPIMTVDETFADMQAALGHLVPEFELRAKAVPR